MFLTMIKCFLSLTLILFSLHSFSQAKAEKINVFWPGENQFNLERKEKKGNEITESFLPKKNSRKKWAMLGTIKTYRNIQTTYSDSIWSIYNKIVLSHSSDAVFTFLEKDTSTKTYWYLYKVQGVFNQKELRQESAIFFLKQGKYNLFEVCITVPDRVFPEGFVEKWVSILKKSEIYYDF
jgi:hypothetical protein